MPKGKGTYGSKVGRPKKKKNKKNKMRRKQWQGVDCMQIYTQKEDASSVKKPVAQSVQKECVVKRVNMRQLQKHFVKQSVQQRKDSYGRKNTVQKLNTKTIKTKTKEFKANVDRAT